MSMSKKKRSKSKGHTNSFADLVTSIPQFVPPTNQHTASHTLLKRTHDPALQIVDDSILTLQEDKTKSSTPTTGNLNQISLFQPTLQSSNGSQKVLKRKKKSVSGSSSSTGTSASKVRKGEFVNEKVNSQRQLERISECVRRAIEETSNNHPQNQMNSNNNIFGINTKNPSQTSSGASTARRARSSHKSSKPLVLAHSLPRDLHHHPQHPQQQQQQSQQNHNNQKAQQSYQQLQVLQKQQLHLAQQRAKDSAEELARKQQAALQKIAKIKAEMRETHIFPINERISQMVLASLVNYQFQAGSGLASMSSASTSGQTSNTTQSTTSMVMMLQSQGNASYNTNNNNNSNNINPNNYNFSNPQQQPQIITSNPIMSGSGHHLKFKQMKQFQLEKEKERQVNLLNVAQRLSDSLLSSIFSVNSKKILGIAEDVVTATPGGTTTTTTTNVNQTASKSATAIQTQQQLQQQIESISREITRKQNDVKQFRIQTKALILQTTSAMLAAHTASLQTIRDSQQSELKAKRLELQLEQSKQRALQSRLLESESTEEKLIEKCEKQTRMLESQEQRLIKFGDSAKILANTERVRESKETIKKLQIDLNVQQAAFEKLTAKHSKRRALVMKQIEEISRTIDNTSTLQNNTNTTQEKQNTTTIDIFTNLFAELIAEPFSTNLQQKDRIAKLIATVPPNQTFDYIPCALLPSEIFESSTNNIITTSTVPLLGISNNQYSQQDNLMQQSNNASTGTAVASYSGVATPISTPVPQNLQSQSSAQLQKQQSQQQQQQQQQQPSLNRSNSHSHSPSPRKPAFKVKQQIHAVDETRTKQSFSEHLPYSNNTNHITPAVPSLFPISISTIATLSSAPPQSQHQQQQTLTPVNSSASKVQSSANVGVPINGPTRFQNSQSAAQAVFKKQTLFPIIGSNNGINYRNILAVSSNVTSNAAEYRGEKHSNTLVTVIPSSHELPNTNHHHHHDILLNQLQQQQNQHARALMLNRTSDETRTFKVSMVSAKKPSSQQYSQNQSQQQQPLQQQSIQLLPQFSAQLPIQQPADSVDDAQLLLHSQSFHQKSFDEEENSLLWNNSANRNNQSHLIRRRSRYLINAAELDSGVAAAAAAKSDVTTNFRQEQLQNESQLQQYHLQYGQSSSQQQKQEPFPSFRKSTKVPPTNMTSSVPIPTGSAVATAATNAGTSATNTSVMTTMLGIPLESSSIQSSSALTATEGNEADLTASKNRNQTRMILAQRRPSFDKQYAQMLVYPTNLTINREAFKRIQYPHSSHMQQAYGQGTNASSSSGTLAGFAQQNSQQQSISPKVSAPSNRGSSLNSALSHQHNQPHSQFSNYQGTGSAIESHQNSNHKINNPFREDEIPGFLQYSTTHSQFPNNIRSVHQHHINHHRS